MSSDGCSGKPVVHGDSYPLMWDWRDRDSIGQTRIGIVQRLKQIRSSLRQIASGRQVFVTDYCAKAN
jgi:hypothetical protein